MLVNRQTWQKNIQANLNKSLKKLVSTTLKTKTDTRNAATARNASSNISCGARNTRTNPTPSVNANATPFAKSNATRPNLPTPNGPAKRNMPPNGTMPLANLLQRNATNATKNPRNAGVTRNTKRLFSLCCCHHTLVHYTHVFFYNSIARIS